MATNLVYYPKAMSAKQEVERYILNNWADATVARWVISQLELLKRAYSFPPCPVYVLSLKEGLHRKNGAESRDEFLDKPKLVTSGGFEGVHGHVRLIEEDLYETRALMRKDRSELPIALLLEPDQYIETKKRKPLVTLKQREEMWSTSGLVDAVVLLPEADSGFTDERYLAIHQILVPAAWSTTIENPHHFNIVMRGQHAIDIILLVAHYPEPHTSFLCSTRDVPAKAFPNMLFQYMLELARNPKAYILPPLQDPEDIAAEICSRLLEGLGVN